MRMKQMMMVALLGLGAGCVPVEEKPGGGGETVRSDLKGAMISGHLGNYGDCPEEGYSAGVSDDSSGPAARDADFAPCESGDDSCGGPLNCDVAQLTIRLTNGGSADISAVEITRIEIFDAQGRSLAELPVIAVSDAASNEEFGGTVDAGSSVDLRVDYRGPANLYDLLPRDEAGAIEGDGDSALIEVEVQSDDGTVVIDGGEVFVLPSVVT